MDDEPPPHRRRDVSLQAEEVLDRLSGGETYLDGFNLLGVIANPRGVPLVSSSFHGRYTPPAESSDVFTDTYYSFEKTLSSVTEQMEQWNLYLEDFSRQLLEEDYGATEDTPLESQLTELPHELEQVDLRAIQEYLRESGEVARSFRQRVRVIPGTKDDDASSRASSVEEEIPDLFFREDLDLSDPQTFAELFGEPEITDDTDGPVMDWFPLPPPDAFSPQLDQIELRLLQQVRNKSSSFFEESIRFAQLEEGIQSLLARVTNLQSTVGHVQTDLYDPLALIPQADDTRQELQRLLQLLDQTSELLRVKGSIAGYLSAQDDLAAIAQIQYGRQLLEGPMGELQALKSVSDQLDQYEQLVVTNLRDELIELFLEWRNPTTTTSASRPNERVQELVNALRQCKALGSTKEVYQNRLLDVIRLTVRTVVGEFASESGETGAARLSLDRFIECLQLIFEQLLDLLTSAAMVDEFCLAEGYAFVDETTENDEPPGVAKAESQDSGVVSSSSTKRDSPFAAILIAASDLTSKLISDLMRSRKEAHSLITLEEMKRLWDTCSSFMTQTESLLHHRSSTLRSTMLSQSKSFVERKHESNMSKLVAALDSERWMQCDVSRERQETLSRLYTGRSMVLTGQGRGMDGTVDPNDRQPYAEVQGIHYKVVWSCLLLIEMVTQNIAAAAQFTSLAPVLVTKVTELLRLFNSRTTQLVLGAGAIHSAARLKSINAKHLALVTQCLGMVISLWPHVRAAFQELMPEEQHPLLSSLDQIRKDYSEHKEKVLNKFVSIINGIVEHGLAPKIGGTVFDQRAKEPASEDGSIKSCVFLDGVATNTRKMHQVLHSLLPPDLLLDVFTRIFASLDQMVPDLLIAANRESEATAKKLASSPKPMKAAKLPFRFPTTPEGKSRLLLEVEILTKSLNSLDGVQAWDFAAVNVLERTLDHTLSEPSPEEDSGAETDLTNDTGMTSDTFDDNQSPRSGTADEEMDEAEDTETEPPNGATAEDEANGTLDEEQVTPQATEVTTL